MTDTTDIAITKTRRTEPFGALVKRLNHASVKKHYDAYTDIAWDDPDYAIERHDPRWVLPADDSLGATAWYQALPETTRAEIGLHMIVDAMKMGAIFEGVLSRGLLEFAATLPNGAPEFRYALHEVIEESQHSLMFQEFINRSGFSPKDKLPAWEAFWARRVVAMGRHFPELFLLFVLGGEAPIDFTQKRALQERKNLPPILVRIMQIHITEEARHLSFARNYLLEHTPKLAYPRKVALAIGAPIIMHEMAGMMLTASSTLRTRYQIPRAVIREAYATPEHRAKVRQSLLPVRELCAELRILNKQTRPMWELARLV